MQELSSDPILGPATRRMEYVLHPDPHGPHPVDGWPGNPWIYQVLGTGWVDPGCAAVAACLTEGVRAEPPVCTRWPATPGSTR